MFEKPHVDGSSGLSLVETLFFVSEAAVAVTGQSETWTAGLFSTL